MMHLTGTFEISAWEETTLHESEEGSKLTRATVRQTFTGDVDGTGEVEWSMFYRSDGTARFVGLQRVEGMFGEQPGSLVAETSGEFDGSTASGTWTIVAGSGERGVTGIEGTGTFSAPRGSTARYSLDGTIP